MLATVEKPAVLYSDRYLDYNFGKDHAFQPIRHKLAVELMESYGLFDGHAELVDPKPAREEDLLLVHARRDGEAVREPSARPRVEPHDVGLRPGDNPLR